MTDIAERAEWITGIHCIDTEEPVLGGPDGPDNLPHRQLANRTAYLKTEVEKRSELGHGHQVADVAGLQAALDAKANQAHQHQVADVTGLQGQLDSLETELRGKVNAAHQHQIADVTGLQTALDGKAAVNHVHDASQITSGTLDPARIPVLPSQKQIASSGALADLTADQVAQVGQGTVVTTTDGFRWVYTGTGDKKTQASYIALADITPEWNTVQNKPATFPPQAHQHQVADVSGLADALAALGALLPPGVIFPSAATGTPSGFLRCDGSAVSRATYGGLYAAIGTTYGNGDGSTTFNLPDLRGRFPVGAKQGQNIGATGGEETHLLTADESPAHRHQMFTTSSGNVAYADSGKQLTTGAQTVEAYTIPGGGMHAESYAMTADPNSIEPTLGATSSVGDGQAHNNLPPFMAVNFIIKT
jgi:microcystin-dependent protein